jgi:ubiquinone/menaquinone biosynthesis C-methylase UbiE
MLLNGFEKLMMNNPARAAIQRQFEARRLMDMGGPLPGNKVLEIGCGRGVGTAIILERFGAGAVDAFDFDPHMVQLAGKRHAQRRNVRLWNGDAAAMALPDNEYDAVFDFGIIHHVPDWRAALRETYRVLKPGGRLYAEEVLARFILHPLWRRLLDHPMEDRFDQAGFEDGLKSCGFQLVASRSLWKHFAFFVADKPA